MSKSKYQAYVDKYSKEETAKEKAAKDVVILAAEMEAKVVGTKAAIIRRKAKLVVAEEAVEAACATATNDVDDWIASVERAEKNRDDAAQLLKNAEDSMEKYEEWHKLFLNN